MIDWNDYKNFTKQEFDCKETAENRMQKRFMDALQAMRSEAGFSFVINSGYRDKSHSAETRKSRRGAHTYGLAADIKASHGEAIWLIENARKYGFNRIGVYQTGLSKWIHLDMEGADNGFLSPALW